ncbi:AlbA family DNA-binding domain-containing protein [Sinimarinibacterium sp. CAU 1509]|uniref:AlbA family DNA-binding domain-containing protein n=1 Tax=Sinimarinibacterium sp. CAU 1509 TaxID=2562283 RepID=UPI00146C3FBA|nr:ATP-binding protein [Sinimarinibacterium sp. CAU 1509]
MDERGLRDFLAQRVPEGPGLDYKRTEYDASDPKGRSEFLKDVCGFANATGGHILLGVREPSSKLGVDDQIVGFPDGTRVAQRLEQLARTWIYPRVPGLLFRVVEIAEAKHCVVIHVPAGASAPHMVMLDGRNALYTRHSESTTLMDLHEIRRAIERSTTARALARQVAAQRLSEVRAQVGARAPALLMQAVPLIALSEPLDVLSDAFDAVIRGNARDAAGFDSSLAVSTKPQPTLEGIRGINFRDMPTVETQVHRDGYVSALYREIPLGPFHQEPRAPFLHPKLCEVMSAFAMMVAEVRSAAGMEIPYLIVGTLLNARGMYLGTQLRGHSDSDAFAGPFDRDDLNWPEQVCEAGDATEDFARNMKNQLYNAFHLPGFPR